VNYKHSVTCVLEINYKMIQVLEIKNKETREAKGECPSREGHSAISQETDISQGPKKPYPRSKGQTECSRWAGHSAARR
jgi:hypothetical protein